MKKLFSLLFFFSFQLIFTQSEAQNVGIGTITPNPNAILDIRSSNKGILFPALTTAQRDAILNPPDGLHIYNKDDRCLNNYDSLYNTWNCYCEYDSCKVIFIRISQNASNINFNSLYASKFPQSRKFTVLIDQGVIISNGINFTTLPTSTTYKIRIVTRGGIYGVGGLGGNGASGQVGAPCTLPAQNGFAGGPAILTLASFVQLTIDNYGIIGGGGGGGGGGGRNQLGQYGGGGGGGAGSAGGGGGAGGGVTEFTLNTCSIFPPVAQFGATSTISAGGAGGAGANGGSDGGTGGGIAQTGLTGLGFAPGIGGAPGKAVASTNGSTGTIINNYGSGQVFGIVY